MTARRVLYVNHEVELGGAERSLLELIGGLDRGRFAPQLACSRPGPLADAAEAAGAAVHPVPMLFRRRRHKALGLWRAAARLRRILAEERIDLVHANSLIAGYAAMLAVRASGVPVVWHVRDIGYPAPARWLCRRAARVIANSRATAESLGLGGATVVHNGVGGAFFSQPDTRAEVRRELGLPLDEMLVATLGRLDPWKGHRVLLAAAPRVLAAAERTTFLIVGDVLFDSARDRLRGYRDELQQQARQLGVADRVRFLGARDDVARILAGVDVLAHPAEAPEPFGRVVAEAQAAGVPAVASELGGIPEIVADGESGFLVPAGDAGALAARILTLLLDPALRQRMGAAARRNARARFTVARHVADVQEVYREVLAGHPEPEPGPEPEPEPSRTRDRSRNRAGAGAEPERSPTGSGRGSSAPA